MSTVAWIHLSDWHQEGPDFDRRVVRDALLADITQRAALSPNLQQIDFAVFSGDLAHGGKDAEYRTAADELLKPLLAAAGLPAAKLFLVPGNHDLDRAALEHLDNDLRMPFGNERKMQEWLTDHDRRSQVLAPFQAYSRFVSSFTGQHTPDYATITRFGAAGSTIALLGVNSALMCGRRILADGAVDDYGALCVGEPQVYQPIRDMADASIRIAVMHHPFNWLCEFDRRRIEDRLGKSCHFILSGHQHEGEVRILSGTRGDCVIVPAGASYDRRSALHPRYVNAYNMVVLDLVTGLGTVYLRRWSDRQNAWVEDTDAHPNAEVQFLLPKGVGPATPTEPVGTAGALPSIAATPMPEGARSSATTTAQELAPVALNQLLADLGDFTGRQRDVRALKNGLKPPKKPVRTAPAVATVYGPPGVGKSSLAIHVAHMLKDVYADAQLYADMRGPDGRPADPADVLGRFLLALGVSPASTPASTEARSDLFRSLLADKRVLVVLDNARDAEQIRSLIPAGAKCAVILTSVQLLPGIASSPTVPLSVMGDSDALKLLRRIAGDGRVDPEEAAAHYLVRELCGGFPLAIRICANRLRMGLGTISDLAARLADQRKRLSNLKSGELDIRASFSVAYEDLPALDQRLFRLLGLLQSPIAQLAVAARFLDVDLATARNALDRLCEAGMLESTGTMGVYVFHGLLRLFAHELCTAQEPHEAVRAAWIRAAPTYLVTAVEMCLRLHSEGPAPHVVASYAPDLRSYTPHAWLTPTDALTWLELEFGNVGTAIEACYEAEQWFLLGVPCNMVMGFLRMRSDTVSMRRVGQYALRSSEKTENFAGVCYSLVNLAQCDRQEGRWADAVVRCEASLRVARDHRLRYEEGASLTALGITCRQQGLVDKAIAVYKESLEIARELGDASAEGEILCDLGIAYRHTALWPKAIECLETSLTIRRASGDVLGEANTLVNLGNVYGQHDRVQDAIDCYEKSLKILEQAGDLRGVAAAHIGLANAYRATEKVDAAQSHLIQGRYFSHAAGDAHGEGIALLNMSSVLTQQGRDTQSGVAAAEGWSLLHPGSHEAKTILQIWQPGQVRVEADD